ncbi:MAG: PAS domain S-box protein [Dehalococcoidia bacterium]|nr:PAS domain S-box protein [Dehalococcoidia bacterium]
MNFIAILHFASFAAYVLLVIYVVSRRSASYVNHLCALLISSLAILSLSCGLLNVTDNLQDAMALVNLAAFGSITGPVFALWFYLALTNREKVLKNRLFIAGSVTVPLILLFMQWSGFIMNGITVEVWGVGITRASTAFTWLYSIYTILLYLACGILLLEMERRADTTRRRKQAILLFATGAATIITVVTLNVLVYGAGMQQIPQVGDIVAMIWVIGIVVATSRYGLLRITPVLASDEILSTMSDSLMLVDNEATIVFANHATCSLLGNAEKKIIGQPFYSLVEDKHKAEELLNTDSSEKKGPLEMVYLSKDGTSIPVLISTSAIRLPGGTTAGSVVSAVDLRQHKKDEENLAAHQRLITGILETMPSAVLVINRQMEIVLANRLFFHDMGWSEGQIENRPLIDIIPSEEFVAQIASAMITDASSIQFEFRYDLNGSSRILVANVFPMPAENILLILNDVTDERERQDRLYLTDRLASIGEMAAGVAHEINNPLTSVIGLSQLLTEQELPADLVEDISTIYREALRASTVVKNLLTFARKRPALRQPVQIHRVIDDVLQLRAYEHRVNNIFITRNYTENLPDVVIDYNQMQQVFVNIVLNSEYEMMQAHRGGSLVVSSKKLEDHISISFSDDGPGISPENLKRVFDPFFTTKEAGKGTGLGLSVCYGIVANHGGKIYAESSPGQGATFIIELPATIPAAEPALQAQIMNFLKKQEGPATDRSLPEPLTREIQI